MNSTDTTTAAIGGTALSLVGMPPTESIYTTMILAAIGAVTSVIVTYLIKLLINQFKSK